MKILVCGAGHGAFIHDDNVIRVREVEDGAGALIEHIGVEFIRAHQGHIPVEASAHGLQAIQFGIK